MLDPSYAVATLHTHTHNTKASKFCGFSARSVEDRRCGRAQDSPHSYRQLLLPTSAYGLARMWSVLSLLLFNRSSCLVLLLIAALREVLSQKQCRIPARIYQNIPYSHALRRLCTSHMITC